MQEQWKVTIEKQGRGFKVTLARTSPNGPQYSSFTAETPEEVSANLDSLIETIEDVLKAKPPKERAQK